MVAGSGMSGDGGRRSGPDAAGRRAGANATVVSLATGDSGWAGRGLTRRGRTVEGCAGATATETGAGKATRVATSGAGGTEAVNAATDGAGKVPMARPCTSRLTNITGSIWRHGGRRSPAASGDSSMAVLSGPHAFTGPAAMAWISMPSCGGAVMRMFGGRWFRGEKNSIVDAIVR